MNNSTVLLIQDIIKLLNNHNTQEISLYRIRIEGYDKKNDEMVNLESARENNNVIVSVNTSKPSNNYVINVRKD